jgi:hypothetical protein
MKKRTYKNAFNMNTLFDNLFENYSIQKLHYH